MYTKHLKHGFTLIELLVVISIITILTGVMIVLINPPVLLAKARDAKRLGLIEELNKAIYLGLSEEEITLVNTSSCTTCTSSTGSLAVNGGGYVLYTIPSGKTGLSKYIPVLPTDPLNTGSTVFSYGSNGIGYELNVVLEAADNATKMTTDGGSSATIYEIGTALNIL